MHNISCPVCGEAIEVRPSMPETLFVERMYFEDIENISGNQQEIELIRAEMRRELVNQLMRRLEAVET